MPVDKALDYPALKDALLKRYDMTEEGFKRRFRSCRPEPGETFIQFSVRLDSYFKRWIDMAHTDTTYISLYDLIIRDQFLHICSKDLSLFLKERIPDSLEKMVALADQYREARQTSASNLIDKGNQSNTSSVRNQSGSKPVDYSTKKEQRSIKPTERTSFVPNRDRKCFRCGKNGHIATDSRVNLQKTNSGSSDDRKNFKGKVCNTCTIPTDSIVDAIPTGCTSTLPLSCQSTANVSMPVSSGYVDGKPVTVLRDTGCSGIVVKRDMVGNESLTGGKQVCILADGTRVEVPIARIDIDTPYLQGEFEGWCMANPVYDLIIGNVEDAREPGKPDPLWQQTGAVETREQVRNKSKPFVQLKVKDIITDEVNPNVIKKAQLEDTTLDKIRRYVLTGDTVTRKNGKVKWILKRGMIYRQFSSSKPDRSMPLINEPFKRVAVDLIGPLFPRTDRGSRYILTLVDYATRYPEAIALKDIETESVAEALVDIFSRVGVPQEMLTDMGSQFTSKLMAEVDYRIQMNGKIKTFHANLLKRYVERCDVDDDLTVVSSAVIDTDSDQVDVYDEIHEIPFTDSGENASHIDVNPDLDENQILQVKELLFSFPEVFTDSPGCTDLLEHDIKLSSETPIRMKPYPIPYSMLDTVNAEVSKMLDLGVIEASTSPYASPIVIVKKKDNTNRFCIDFRSLNSQTLFDAEPMGNAEEMFSKLAGHKYFSRIDLSKGYWQLPLSEDAKPKTAFQTPKDKVKAIEEAPRPVTKKQPLTYLNKKKVENARLMRWALALQPYRFRIVAVKGIDNVGADYLSRV
ncbi:uncharacterized protein LOC127717282 [Mytilus californianus]|uniref:uncharacterized protein LOC127717282 n=1 Tax=Mytilus californianus TaxID=6549 RepID=UPI0022472569|nr:uncharacterized protein LOC127717282 [Mytilus californianus]